MKPAPVMIHSGEYPCSWALEVRKIGMAGSQPQMTVVIFSLFSLAMMLAAWFDSVLKSSLYLMLSWLGWPAARATFSPASTHCWYQGFSGAMMAVVRGLSFRSPWAYLAGLPARRLLT